MKPEMVEKVAATMHDRYEMVAAAMGWATNPASRKPWADVPEPNKQATREIARYALALAERAARAGLRDGGRSIYRTEDQDVEAAVERAVEGA